MTGPDPSDERAEDEQAPPVERAGVLGNLPKTRPQVRSPRRKDRPAPEMKPPATAAAQAARKPREPRAAQSPPPPRAEAGATSDLEAIARGGLQIAGEAASLGLRIAGRAAAAIRDSAERR